MEKIRIKKHQFTNSMTKLGVNIDHSATIRQARYRDSNESEVVIEPSILDVAAAAERGGADSITVHLREDRRHIQDSDVRRLRKEISTKLNLEMACTPEITEIARQIMPDYACLVPENRMEVTTEGGLDIAGNIKKVEETVSAINKKNIVCSIFIDPDPAQIKLAKQIGAPMVELHTGAYANAWKNPGKRRAELERISRAAEFAVSIGLVVNSGHGINYLNVRELLSAAKFNELNIGHTIISRAIIAGMENAVREMKELLK